MRAYVWVLGDTAFADPLRPCEVGVWQFFKGRDAR